MYIHNKYTFMHTGKHFRIYRNICRERKSNRAAYKVRIYAGARMYVKCARSEFDQTHLYGIQIRISFGIVFFIWWPKGNCNTCDSDALMLDSLCGDRRVNAAKILAHPYDIWVLIDWRII